ncbi:MAG: hypothetical protein JO345_07590, partial [Streptosporangiaceae bacterium]|nr:hypothetical protein [Streptosporangiaceae bacterium]
MIEFDYLQAATGPGRGVSTMEGPVPAGGSTRDLNSRAEDAMIAGHAAYDDEPPWLEDDLPPDP